jgi:hypothetical protein
MDQCLKNLVMQGAVTRDEAARKSSNPALFLGGAAEPAPNEKPGSGQRKAA